MYEDLFNKLASRNKLEDNLHTVCGGMTWEQIAIALCSITEGMKEAESFRETIRKLQEKKCRLLEEKSLEGGWIHPNGRIEYIPDYRGEKHWEDAFKKRYGEENYDYKKAIDAAMDLIEDGYIRFIQDFLPDELYVQVGKKPTQAQIRSLAKLAKENNYFTADIEYLENIKIATSWDNFRSIVLGTDESKIKEAVATALGTAERRMKEVHKDILNTELKNSTWTTEEDWKKFWLLSDGTIVPVQSSHAETAAGIYIPGLYDEGALSGYIEEDQKEMGISGRKRKPSFPQISKIRDLYNKYDVDTILGDMFDQKWAYVPSSRDLVKYLRTGKGREKKAWESIKEDILDILASCSEIHIMEIFDKLGRKK